MAGEDRGEGGGVQRWDARPSVFPHGLAALHSETGWKQMLHNRYWDPDTTYSKQNGGQVSHVDLKQGGLDPPPILCLHSSPPSALAALPPPDSATPSRKFSNCEMLTARTPALSLT